MSGGDPPPVHLKRSFRAPLPERPAAFGRPDEPHPLIRSTKRFRRPLPEDGGAGGRTGLPELALEDLAGGVGGQDIEEFRQAGVPASQRRPAPDAPTETGDPDDDALPPYTKTDEDGVSIVYHGGGEIDIKATAELAAQHGHHEDAQDAE
ncbi:hypothetical protein ACTMTU_35415 [Streptomyces sp. OZ13]|uniref:hypothetical protein n=1 Tax=Streptomyces sp. OZ13 TaxID=3452210 RepID=UPI003F8A2879